MSLRVTVHSFSNSISDVQAKLLSRPTSFDIHHFSIHNRGTTDIVRE